MANPIPNLPPLSTIKDPDVRAMFQALQDGWNVRNGNTGTGDEKFITVADLSNAMTSTPLARGGWGGANGNISGRVSGALTRVIDGLVQSLSDKVTNSKLWNDLAQPIADLTKPDGKLAKLEDGLTASIRSAAEGITRLDTLADGTAKTLYVVKQTADHATAGIAAINTVTANSDSASARAVFGIQATMGGLSASISNEQYVRATNDSAIISAVNTLWGHLSGASALVQDGATVTVTAQGAVANKWSTLQTQIAGVQASASQALSLATSVNGVTTGSWSVKFDVNGYISGVGLGVQAGLGTTPTSAFIVRADSFAIGEPTVGTAPPVVSPKLPFIVQTSAWHDSQGYLQPAGVYINEAFITTAHIGVGQIDSAMIGDAEVGTLKLGGHAVTIPVVLTATDTVSGTGATVNLLVGVVNLPYDAVVFASFTANQTYGSGLRNSVTGLYIDGTQMMVCGGSAVTTNITMAGAKNCLAGPRQVVVNWSGQDSGVRVDSRILYISAVMR